MSTTPYTTDTSPEAAAVHLECLRRMTPQQRFRRSNSMSHQVKRMALNAIRRRHPEFSDQQVRLRYIELAYGQQLADEVRRWLEERGD